MREPAIKTLPSLACSWVFECDLEVSSEVPLINVSEMEDSDVFLSPLALLLWHRHGVVAHLYSCDILL